MSAAKHKFDHATMDGKSVDSRRVVGNILSLGTCEVTARLIAFLGTSYLARKLGPDGFGVIGFATALFGYLALAVTAGFNDVGSREVARRPHEAATIATSVILVRVALAFVALAAIALVALSLDKPPTVKAVIILM